jgi:TolB-like protein
MVPVRPIADKSIAVLPFSNMSEDKEASAFFSDGIHEDILTNLALIRELRVVSRTTVMQYRDTKKTMKQIAQELGVTYILEGSVRRSGNKVRVTGQLIHAATDEHVWAEKYDRDLTDIFEIQDEIMSPMPWP